MIKLNVGSIPAIVKGTEYIPRRPAWYKASEMDTDQYTSSLHSKIANLKVPDSLSCDNPHCQDHQHSADRDSYVLDVLTSIVETSHQTIPMTGGGKKSSDPDKNCPIGQAVPGWREHVKPF